MSFDIKVLEKEIDYWRGLHAESTKRYEAALDEMNAARDELNGATSFLRGLTSLQTAYSDLAKEAGK